MENLMISPWSLVLTFSLVLIAMGISYKEKIGLTNEIFWAIFRMIIQLIIVGYLLTLIFGVDSVWVTLGAVMVMIINAAWNAAKRGQGILHAFKYSLMAMTAGSVVSLSILLLAGAINFVPSEVIPINGMIIGNSMNVLGLSFRNLKNQYKSDRQQVLEKLALGADIKQASKDIISEAIRGSLQPSIDSTKTVGLVTLPGMMTGMIMAGVSPVNAIMYQILVFFMMMSTASITSVAGVYLTYKEFFTDFGQLKNVVRKDS